MWVQSSEDETSPIFCNFCSKPINEEDYSAHWRACKVKASQPKPTATVTPKEEPKPRENNGNLSEESGEEDSYNCPNCSFKISFAKLEEHTEQCKAIELEVECKYCQAKLPVALIDNHESTCDSSPLGMALRGGRPNQQQMSVQQFMEAIRNAGNNGSGGNRGANGSGNGGSNPNVTTIHSLGGNGSGAAISGGGINIQQLLQLRGALGGNSQGGGNSGIDPTEDLLQNSLFPALMKMDRGMKKRDIEELPTEPYRKSPTEEPRCSICMTDFEEGESVMRAVCNHIHHEICFKQWLQHNNTCPLCKVVIKAPKPSPKPSPKKPNQP